MRELDSLLNALDAQQLFRGYTVHVFSGDVRHALTEIRKHPAVRFASTSGVGAIIAFFDADGTPRSGLDELPRVVQLVVPTTTSPSPSNRLQVEPGARVTAMYEQPDGSTFEASVVVR